MRYTDPIPAGQVLTCAATQDDDMLSFFLVKKDPLADAKEKFSLKFKLTNLDLSGMYPWAGPINTWAGWGYIPAWLMTPKYAAVIITHLIEKEKFDGRVLDADEGAEIPPKKGKKAEGPGRLKSVSPATKEKGSSLRKAHPRDMLSQRFEMGSLAEYEVPNSVFSLRRPSDNREVLEIIADSARVQSSDGSPLTAMIDKATLACPTGTYKARELNLSHVDTMEASLRVRPSFSPMPAASAATHNAPEGGSVLVRVFDHGAWIGCHPYPLQVRYLPVQYNTSLESRVLCRYQS